MKQTLILCALSAAAFSQATVLTFDIDNASDGMVMPQDYGDNVSAATMGSYHYGMGTGFTPDVAVQYLGSPGSPNDLNFWSTGYNDLTNVLEYEPDGFPEYSVVFSASAGNQVVLESFDMGNFGPEITVPGVTIRDENGTVVWQMANIALPAGSVQSHLHFDLTGVTGQTLTMRVDLAGLGGNSDNVGLDNISFGQQAVPEPATLAVLALGAAAFARKRR